jgi:hypothetical protein
MIRIAEKLGLQMETLGEVCQRNDNQLLNSCFAIIVAEIFSK